MISVFQIIIPGSGNHIMHHHLHHHHPQSPGLWRTRRGKAGRERRAGGRKAIHNCLQMLPPPPFSLSFFLCPSEGNFQTGGRCDGSLPFRCNYSERDWTVKTWKTSQRLSGSLCFLFCLWGPYKGGAEGGWGTDPFSRSCTQLSCRTLLFVTADTCVCVSAACCLIILITEWNKMWLTACFHPHLILD